MILGLVIGIEDATQEGGNPELWEKHSKKIAQKKQIAKSNSAHIRRKVQENKLDQRGASPFTTKPSMFPMNMKSFRYKGVRTPLNLTM